MILTSEATPANYIFCSGERERERERDDSNASIDARRLLDRVDTPRGLKTKTQPSRHGPPGANLRRANPGR